MKDKPVAKADCRTAGLLSLVPSVAVRCAHRTTVLAGRPGFRAVAAVAAR